MGIVSKRGRRFIEEAFGFCCIAGDKGNCGHPGERFSSARRHVRRAESLQAPVEPVASFVAAEPWSRC